MFDQSPFDCRIEWAQRGAREAAERGDITIIVDVLSFSTTVVVAVKYGAYVFPFPPPLNESARKYAEELGAEVVLGRAEASKLGGHSLSPTSFSSHDAGKKFVLCSLNGAACASIASKVPALLVGSLVNFSAVADRANHIQGSTGANITVIPCGEKWPYGLENENTLRPGIEDYLGAGAVLSKLKGSKSPEVQVCIGAFEYSKNNLQQLIWDCGSGRELRERGFEQDVSFITQQLDHFQNVPVLQGDRFINASEVIE